MLSTGFQSTVCRTENLYKSAESRLRFPSLKLAGVTSSVHITKYARLPDILSDTEDGESLINGTVFFTNSNLIFF